MTEIFCLEALEQAPVQTTPFVFTVAEGCLSPDAREDLARDFPKIEYAGSVPVQSLRYGPAFTALLGDLQSPSFTHAVASRLNMDLSEYPLLITVRGQCRNKDGRIHMDATWKLASLLLYMNEPWQSEGGRLRLLRSANMDDLAAEVPPEFGNVVAFRRSDRSFHGHKPYEGERRVVQVNWIIRREKLASEIRRLERFAYLKRRFPFLASWGY